MIIINENLFGDNNTLEWNSNSKIGLKISDNFNLESDIYFTSYKTEEDISSVDIEEAENYFDQFLIKSEVRGIVDLGIRNKLIFGIGYIDESLSRNDFFKNKERKTY